MKKTTFLFLIFTFICAGVVNSQQIKRNMVANSNFEDGLKHWRRHDAGAKVTFSEETDAPISGLKSAKVHVNSTTGALWDTALKYFFPLKSTSKYKVSFKAKASSNVNIGIEFTLNRGPWTLLKSESRSSSMDGFTPVHVSGNPDRSNLPENALCGTFPITTETTEYWFITDGTNITDWNYNFSFCFGFTPAGTTVWIDDVRIEHADEGDWDGNLFPYGDFEEGIAPVLWGPPHDGDGSMNFRIEKDGARTDTWEVSTDSPISGTKSLLINRTSGDGVFWNFVFLFQYWTIEHVKSQIFYDIKSTNEGMISKRLASEPWDRPIGGDHLVNDVKVTPTLQTVELSPDSKTGGNNTATGDYTWDPFWQGRMKVFTSFTEGPNQFPQNTKIWIDNIKVYEYDLNIISFDVINAPEQLQIGAKQAISIANVYPTHAPSKVIFSVNDDNIATIDSETGLLTGVSAGTAVVTVTSQDGKVSKSVNVEIANATGVNNISDSNLMLYPTIANRGNVIEILGVDKNIEFTVYNANGRIAQNANSRFIDTNNLIQGLYFVKFNDKSSSTKRFIVK